MSLCCLKDPVQQEFRQIKVPIQVSRTAYLAVIYRRVRASSKMKLAIKARVPTTKTCLGILVVNRTTIC